MQSLRGAVFVVVTGVSSTCDENEDDEEEDDEDNEEKEEEQEEDKEDKRLDIKPPPTLNNAMPTATPEAIMLGLIAVRRWIWCYSIRKEISTYVSLQQNV